jgi:hypothetical protein
MNFNFSGKPSIPLSAANRTAALRPLIPRDLVFSLEDIKLPVPFLYKKMGELSKQKDDAAGYRQIFDCSNSKI